jgi:hypothetical protein
MPGLKLSDPTNALQPAFPREKPDAQGKAAVTQSSGYLTISPSLLLGGLFAAFLSGYLLHSVGQSPMMSKVAGW